MYKHMAKVVINILQGSVVTQTVLGGLTIYPPDVPKIMKISWQLTKLLQKLPGLFFGPPCTSGRTCNVYCVVCVVSLMCYICVLCF